ncbi:uncharacterized protein LOC119834696 isoform X1 [Zerene cesonia]|uniref:uncharacterized protein LOC119834696 isoform X1 n=1 Tax=Zerene cesonia TaxID=33412 RepID=UPI0018E54ADA|nr:uncharacterized protein LOC119834696 isoform X1 [Zerene cesonia]
MPPNGTENLLPQETPIRIEKAINVDKVDKNERHCEKDEVTETPVSCTCKEVGYGAGDAIFASVVVTPLVVGVWRGTWGVMELHPRMFPYARIYILGMLIHTCLSVAKTRLFARSANAWSEGGAGRWLRERVLTCCYTYIFILSCIMHWRGGWGLIDSFVDAVAPDSDDPLRLIVIAAYVITFYIMMTFLRSSRNILAPPYFLVTDGKEATYMFNTRFRMSSRETALYILDCVFSVTVVGSLVVFVWRGSWALLDIFLFPDDPSKSCWTSLIMGYSLVVVTFSLQVPMRWAAAKLQGAGRLLLVDFYHLVSFLATVNVWRGVWGLLDIYFYPESPKLSNWSSHIVSLALLILLNCSNSILVRGVYIDAEEPAGDCVIFPCHYLRLFFHKERSKKRHKLALAAADRKMEEANVPLQTPEEKV